MIIKIDHITICSADFESDLNYFSNLGFHPKILNRKLKNLEIKKGLMKNFSEHQKFALLESKNNLDIEILGYDNVNNGTSYIEPEFLNSEKRLNNYLEFEGHFQKHHIPIKFSSDKNFTDFRFRRIKIYTSSVINSQIFWEKLGFKTISEKNNRCVKMIFNDLTNNQSLELILEYTEIKNIHYLDDKGFNCIAFITNSVVNQKKLFDEQNYQTTDIENFEIGKKKMDIFFCTSPQGEIIELISLRE
jgi:hypothetical protein